MAVVVLTSFFSVSSLVLLFLFNKNNHRFCLIGLVDSFWLRRRGDHAVVDYNGCRDAMRRDSWWRWLESRTGRQLRAILFKAWRTYNTSYYLYHHLLSLVFSSLHFPEHISIAAVWPTYLFGAQVFDIFPTTHWNATTVRSSIYTSVSDCRVTFFSKSNLYCTIIIFALTSGTDICDPSLK